METLAYLLLAFGVYFAPAIVADSRGHKNKLAIGILNLLLGWTVLGWIGALVWAFTSPGERAAATPKPAVVDVTPAYSSEVWRDVSRPLPGTTKKCPFCAEEIQAEAIKCKHCKSDLPAS